MVVLVLTLLTFALVTVIVLSFYAAVTAESPAAQRLRSLVPQAAETRRSKEKKSRPGSGILRRVLATLGQYGLGGDDSSLTQSLAVAGIRSRQATALFVGVRTLISVGPALIILVQQVSAGRPLGRSLLLAFLAWLYGHLIANLWLKYRARRRARSLEISLPDALDLMVVCLEAGLGLNATISRVGEERAAMDDALGQEFNQVALELREGRSREEALRGLGERNGVEDLRSLSSLIIQSDRLGASMAKTLRAHADVLRTKRRQRAEEAARKLPIKILFPLAGCILPALLIIAIGPALLRINELFRSMSQR